MRPAPALIAEVLSRRLSRTVTIADAGLAGQRPAPPAGRDPAAVLAELAVLAGRGGGADEVYSRAALAVPGWHEALAAPALALPTGAASRDQVAAAEAMERVFSDADTIFGGGYVREPLAAYLACDIAPRLRAAAGPVLRHRLLHAATRLVYLCGFACFDDERQRAAQRYYLTGLELAVANNDPRSYAAALRALSVQASALGHHREALDLAEGAVAAAHGSAFLRAQVAVAAAGTGDRATAVAALSAAERQLSRAGSASGSLIGEYHLAAFAHQEAVVRMRLGDRAGAICSMSTSLRHRPAREHRSRAVTTAWLAEVRLTEGHLEEAVATWDAFLDDCGQLRSGRVTTALRTLRSRVLPYSANPAARRLLARCAEAGPG